MSKTEKDRLKAQQEKFQAILSSLLKDDDNKYCVDCDAKGPRWASWNLGIFLCIRCAGIHRKMGVHVSKVKSVNLDTWTPEQVAMMQEVGNSRARAAYEAEIPDNFRRPQTDSALESFIRTKYEHKKYLAREWVAPKPTVPKEVSNEWLEDDKDKKKSKPKSTGNIQLHSASANVKAKSTPAEKKSPENNHVKPNPPQPTPPKSSGAADLIGLDASSPTGQPNGGDLLADIFGSNDPGPAQSVVTSNPNQAQPVQNGDLEANLFDDTSSEGKASEKNTKDSILALYGSSTSQQQMFGVPAANSDPSYSENLLLQSSPYAYQAPIQQQQVQQQQQQQQQPFLLDMQPCQPGSPYGIGAPSFCFMDPGGMYMPQQNMYGMMPGQSVSGQQMMGQQQMPVQQGMQGMMPQQQQQGMMRMQQPNMYGMGQVGVMPGGMMGQGNMMMPPQGNTFNPQQQQQMQQIQYQQMQQQLAAMKLSSGQMGGTAAVPQSMGGQGGQNWMPANTGQTLSNNLWQ